MIICNIKFILYVMCVKWAFISIDEYAIEEYLKNDFNWFAH